MVPIKICLWQYSPSIHQVALVKALKNKTILTWILENRQTDPERVKMGWNDGDLQPDIILSENDIDIILKSVPDDCVHIFGGTRSSRKMRKVYKELLSKNARVFVQTETPNYYHLKDKIKLIRGFVENIYEYRKVEGIFAIGSLAVNYFKLIGFNKSKLYPFGYFTENKYNPKTEGSTNTYKIIYVGQLNDRKGVDILLKSLINITENFCLNIIGKGINEEKLLTICDTYKLTHKVNFLGNLNNNIALEHIGTSDLLVLPSRWDGWGAVVSEALMQGTPVIATDKCGSSILLNEGYRGEVVKSGSIQSLEKAIKSRMNNGKLTEEQREKILKWSKCIHGDVAAKYMIDCIKGKKPRNPWL